MTNGLDVGIVRLVGQALDKIRLMKPEKEIISIAVAKFGCITNYDSLKNNTSQVKIIYTQYILYVIIIHRYHQVQDNQENKMLNCITLIISCWMMDQYVVMTILKIDYLL